MSSFLTQDTNQTFKERVNDILAQTFSDPLNPIFDVFKSSIPGYLEINPPTLPITQITGFISFNPNTATVAAAVSTSSASYVSLTGGPTISDLADGSYLVMYSSYCNPSASNPMYASPSFNGGTPIDDNAITVATGGNITLTGFTFADLSNGANTIELQYKSSGGVSPTWLYRRISAFKYKNP